MNTTTTTTQCAHFTVHEAGFYSCYTTYKFYMIVCLAFTLSFWFPKPIDLGPLNFKFWFCLALIFKILRLILNYIYNFENVIPCTFLPQGEIVPPKRFISRTICVVPLGSGGKLDPQNDGNISNKCHIAKVVDPFLQQMRDTIKLEKEYPKYHHYRVNSKYLRGTEPQYVELSRNAVNILQTFCPVISGIRLQRLDSLTVDNLRFVDSVHFTVRCINWFERCVDYLYSVLHKFPIDSPQFHYADCLLRNIEYDTIYLIAYYAPIYTRNMIDYPDTKVDFKMLPNDVCTLIDSYVGGYKTVRCQMDCPKPPIKNINEALMVRSRNHNFSRKIMFASSKFNDRISQKDIAQIVRFKQKVKKLHPQMEYLKQLIPTAKLDINVDHGDIVAELKGLVDSVLDKGVTHNINVPAFTNLFQQLSFCWENELVRNTLLLVLYIVLKFCVLHEVSILSSLVDMVALYLSTTIKDKYLLSIVSGIITGNSLYQFYKMYSYMNTECRGSFDYNSNEVYPQMEFDYIEPLLLPLYSWMYYCAYSKEYKGDQLTSFLKECKDVKKAKEGFKDLIDFVLDCFKKLTVILAGGSFSQIFSNNAFPQLDEYSAQVEDYLIQYNKGFPFSKDDAMRIIQIASDLDKLIFKIPNNLEYADYKKKAIQLSNSVSNFVKEIKKAGLFDDGSRFTPTAVLLVGPSATGKTTTMPQFVYELAACTMDEKTYEAYQRSKDDFQYTYNPENEYFDRYRKQWFCIVDEFGALRDSPSKPNEGYLFTMRAINCWAYPIHMADLADKGMMFDSKIVLAVGNIKHLMCNSLICPEAVSRRFDFVFLVVPKEANSKPGFTSDPWSRRLDVSSLTDDITNTDHLEFYPYDIVNGVTVSSPITWRSAVDSIAIKFHEKQNFSKKRLDAIPSIASKCVNLRKQFFPQMEVSSDREICLRMQSISERFNAFSDITNSVITICKDVCTDLQNNISSILNFVKNNSFVATISIATPILYTIWNTFYVFIRPQSAFARPVKMIRPAARAKSRVVKSRQKEQMCVANVEFDNVSSCILKANHYKIFSCGARGYITFIKGRVAVMPHHFYDVWSDCKERGDNVILEIEKALCPGQKIEVNFDDIEFNELPENNDIIFCYFKTMYMHRDITKFLVTKEDKSFHSRIHCCLARFKDNILKLHTTEAIPVGYRQYSFYTNSMSYEYRIATTIGECGQILLSSDTKTSTKLMGIHTAGDGSSEGLSVALYKEDFDASFDDFINSGCSHVDVQVEEEFLPKQVQMAGIHPKFCVIRQAKKALSIPTKTKIIKTPLHNAWHVSPYGPALLYKKDGRDPWIESRQNYSPNIKSADYGLLQACRNAYFTDCLSNMKKDWTYDGVLDFETSVRGIPGRMKGLNRKSASGFLESFDIPGKGKYSLFGSDGDYDFSSELCKDFKKHLQSQLELLKQNKKVNFIFTDYLKDERRKIGKSTRLFSASPVEYTIPCRQYFGSFTQWIIDNRIHNGICIGINPFSQEWDTVAKFLLSVGDNCVFGDFTAYDASLFMQILYEALAFIESWYFWQGGHLSNYNEEKVVRAALFESLVNSAHVCLLPSGVFIYEFVGCVPSGHMLTTFINSICNNILMLYCICKIHYGFSDCVRFPTIIPDFKFIMANYRLITFGDDNGLSVSSELINVNQRTLAEAMESIGMKYTSEDKSENDYTHRSITDCSFLKCTFRYDKKLKRYVAAQALSSILDMPYWSKSDIKDETSVEETVDLLLAKLSLWGEPIYNEWAPKIISNSIKRINYNPIRQDYGSNQTYILSYQAEYM